MSEANSVGDLDPRALHPVRARRKAAKIKKTHKRIDKRSSQRVSTRVHNLATTMWERLRAGVSRLYNAGFEFGVSLRRTTSKKIHETLERAGVDLGQAKASFKKSAWYAFQTGKYLVYVGAAGVVITSLYGYVLSVLTAPLVIAAGLLAFSGRLFAGGKVFNFLTGIAARVTGNRTPALAVVV